MSPELKKQIDEMDHLSLARVWRFAPVGEPLLAGETGAYFLEVLRSKGGMTPEISKQLGWRGSHD